MCEHQRNSHDPEQLLADQHLEWCTQSTIFLDNLFWRFKVDCKLENEVEAGIYLGNDFPNAGEAGDLLENPDNGREMEISLACKEGNPMLLSPESSLNS